MNKRTNINLDTEDVAGIALIRQHYGLATDASAIRFAIRKVESETKQDVSGPSRPHRENGRAR